MNSATSYSLAVVGAQMKSTIEKCPSERFSQAACITEFFSDPPLIDGGMIVVDQRRAELGVTVDPGSRTVVSIDWNWLVTQVIVSPDVARVQHDQRGCGKRLASRGCWWRVESVPVRHPSGSTGVRDGHCRL